MAELVCRSSDYSTISVKVLENYRNKRREGTFDKFGYVPSKEFIKKKKEIIKQREILSERNFTRVTYQQTKRNTDKLGNSLESYIRSKYI